MESAKAVSLPEIYAPLITLEVYPGIDAVGETLTTGDDLVIGIDPGTHTTALVALSPAGGFWWAARVQTRATRAARALSATNRCKWIGSAVAWFLRGAGTPFLSRNWTPWIEIPDGLDTGRMKVFGSPAGLVLDAVVWAIISTKLDRPATDVSRAKWARGRSNAHVLGEAVAAVGWSHMGQDVADAWGVACHGVQKTILSDIAAHAIQKERRGEGGPSV